MGKEEGKAWDSRGGSRPTCFEKETEELLAYISYAWRTKKLKRII